MYLSFILKNETLPTHKVLSTFHFFRCLHVVRDQAQINDLPSRFATVVISKVMTMYWHLTVLFPSKIRIYSCSRG